MLSTITTNARTRVLETNRLFRQLHLQSLGRSAATLGLAGYSDTTVEQPESFIFRRSGTMLKIMAGLYAQIAVTCETESKLVCG